MYHKYDLQPMNLYSWIKIDTKCRRERHRYTLSLSWFSYVYMTMFPPVALLLNSCSNLSSFIMLYIVIFVFKYLIIFVSHHFWSVTSLLVFPFYSLPVFFPLVFCSFLKGLCIPSPFCLFFLAPFLIYLFRISPVWD